MHTDRARGKRSGRTWQRGASVALACLVVPATVMAGCKRDSGSSGGASDLASSASVSEASLGSGSAVPKGSGAASAPAASSAASVSVPRGFVSSCSSQQSVTDCKSSSNELKCPEVGGEGALVSDVQVIVDANNDETGGWWSWLLAPGAIDAPGCMLQTSCAGSYRSIQYDAELMRPAPGGGSPQCVKIERGQPVQNAEARDAADRARLTPAQHAMELAAKRMTENGENGVTVLAFDGMVDEKGKETVTADGFAKEVWKFVQAGGKARGLFVVAAPAQYRYIYVIAGADRLGYGRELAVALKERLSSNLAGGKKRGNVFALELSPGFRPEVAATDGRPLGDKETKKADDAQRDEPAFRTRYADVTNWLRGTADRAVYDLTRKGRQPPEQLKQLQAGSRLIRTNVDRLRILGKGSLTAHWATEAEGAGLGLELGKLQDCTKSSSQVVAQAVQFLGQEGAAESCAILELGNVVRGYVALDEDPESTSGDRERIAKLVVVRQTEDPERGLAQELKELQDAGTKPGQLVNMGFPALYLVQTYDNSDKSCVDAATKLAASLLLDGGTAPSKLTPPSDCSASSKKPSAEIISTWAASTQSRYGAVSGKTGLDRRGGAYPLFVLMQRATESLRQECSLFRLETGVSCAGKK